MDILEQFGLLIKNNADVNAKNNLNGAPLHNASHEGYIRVVQLLIDNNADVNAKDNRDLTALHYASQKGHVRVVQTLIENNANVNMKDTPGQNSPSFGK